MSDPASPSAGTGITQFTEREMQQLCWAMMSLKSGPPEIDYEKFAAFAGMSNSKSANNAWAKLKKKLMTDGAVPPATPKKAAPKKKATKADSDDGETPKKATPRKRAAKKQEVEDGEASPKKKGRSAKASKSEELVDLKAESDEAEASGEDLAVKGEPKAEEDDEAI